MVARQPREEDFSKDASKLIRRLSLLTFLLTHHGRTVHRDDIRQRVEGYALMTEPAFKRRFYEDRDELARLGIAIHAEPEPSGAGELYSLPPDNYYLPPIELSGDELAALGSCLAVLENRFAYSKPLRLALMSLAQGRPELLRSAGVPQMAVLPERDARRAAKHLPKLQTAIAKRKAVVFCYYSIQRDEESPRHVDPYGLMMVGDEWYLIGYCHDRQALRTFRLSRIRSAITYAKRSPHNFSQPAGFSLAAYRDRPPWQLGEPTFEALIRVQPDMAWWVQAHYAHCGELTPADDESLLFRTSYAASRPLVAWALALGEQAEILQPPQLRQAAVASLDLLRQRLLDPPSVEVAEVPPREPRADTTHNGDWQVEVDRFTRLTALSSYLLRRCEDRADQVRLAIAEVCHDLALTPSELREDVRVLNLVNFGGDGALLFGEIKGKWLEVSCDLAGPALAPAAQLSPLQADTLLLAIELVGGQMPSSAAATLRSAAAKLRRARRDEPPLLASDALLNTRHDILAAVSESIRSRRLLAIDYWSEGTGESTSRLVEPYLLLRSRGEWYYVCYCRTSAGTRVFRIDTTKTVHLLPEHFTPRDDVELELYRQEGIPASHRYLARSAIVWYSPTVARWIAERQSVRALPDGSCVARQPYRDESWLVHYLLRFGGQAIPLEPSPAVDALRATVTSLLARYETVA